MDCEKYTPLKGQVGITCKICGKNKIIRRSRKTENNYCSLECYYKSLVGGKNYGMRGKRHPNWKGDEAKYSSMHDWVRRKKGKASNYKCAYCEKQARDWANIDHKVSRDLEDYMPLCRKCHIKFDKAI